MRTRVYFCCLPCPLVLLLLMLLGGALVGVLWRLGRRARRAI